MQKFPKLEDGQVALLRSDFNTGIVLDENYRFSMNESQIVFNIFSEVNIALEFAKKILIERANVECTIFDKNENVIFYFRSLEDFTRQTN